MYQQFRALRHHLSDLFNSECKQSTTLRPDAIKTAQVKLDAYEYQPLSSDRSIRLLRIGGVRKDQTVEIELVDTNLNSCPPYEALSYVWGDGGLSRKILCCGEAIDVTLNCEAALLRLSDRQTRYFWVDSICINQKSLLEKSKQISLMGEIYGQAAQVVIWLGDETLASTQSLQYLNAIWRIFSLLPETDRALINAGQHPQHFMDAVEEMRSKFQEENRRLYNREGTADSNMLSDIFKRKWFSRLWTLQELVMAREAVFICGKSEIVWGHLLLALTYLVVVEQKKTSTFMNESRLFPRIVVYRNLRQRLHEHLRWTFQRAITSGSQSDTLGSILVAARHLKSSNPRDALYGLFSYLKARGLQDMPVIDYTKSVRQVYAEFTKSVMHQDQSLDLLTHVEGIHAQQDLPSWCPDWSSHGHGQFLYLEHFAASKKSQVQMSFDEDCLCVTGIVIGQIKHRASFRLPSEEILLEDEPQMNTPEFFLPNIIQRVRTWQEWTRMAVNRSSDGSIVPETMTNFCNVILRDGVIGRLPQHRLSTEVLSQLKEWLALLMIYEWEDDLALKRRMIFDDTVDFALSRPATSIYYSTAAEKEAISQVKEWRILMALVYGGTGTIQKWIFEFTRGRTIFFTEEGCLGSGMDAVEAGDQIMLIRGLNIPMIVRLSEHGFMRFVGPAYMVGCMQGELWPADENVLSEYIFS